MPRFALKFLRLFLSSKSSSSKSRNFFSLFEIFVVTKKSSFGASPRNVLAGTVQEARFFYFGWRWHWFLRSESLREAVQRRAVRPVRSISRRAGRGKDGETFEKVIPRYFLSKTTRRCFASEDQRRRRRRRRRRRLDGEVSRERERISVRA